MNLLIEDSLPDINPCQKRLYPYNTKNNENMRYRDNPVKAHESDTSSLIGSKDVSSQNMKSNNIYVAPNSRNNIKLLENNEGMFRARSYNNSSKNKKQYLKSKPIMLTFSCTRRFFRY